MVGGGVISSPKGKKEVGRGSSLDHLRPKGLVGLGHGAPRPCGGHSTVTILAQTSGCVAMGHDRLQLRPRSQIRQSRAAGGGRDSASDDSSSGGDWCAYDADDSSREPSPPAQRALATPPRTLGGDREPPVQPHDDDRVTTDFTDHGVRLTDNTVGCSDDAAGRVVSWRQARKRRKKAGVHPQVRPSKGGRGDHIYGPGWDSREPENIDMLVNYLWHIGDSALESRLCRKDRAYLHRLAEEHPTSETWLELQVFHVWLEIIRDLPGVENQLGTIAIRLEWPEGAQQRDKVIRIKTHECVKAMFPGSPLVMPPLMNEVNRAISRPAILPYNQDCHGVPRDWNRRDAEVYWGARTRARYFRNHGGIHRSAAPDIDIFLEFLHQRNILDKFYHPDYHEGGWYRLHWKGMHNMWQVKGDGWMRAWHGIKLEALYSIAEHGYLFESSDCNQEAGERTLAGASGVYCHKDSTHGKAHNYLRFVDLFGDGVFWAAQFELLVDPGKAVKLKKRTDQWAYPSEGVKITALWICARASTQMVDGDAVSIVGWNPLLEANPHASHRSRGSGQRDSARCGTASGIE